MQAFAEITRCGFTATHIVFVKFSTNFWTGQMANCFLHSSITTKQA